MVSTGSGSSTVPPLAIGIETRAMLPPAAPWPRLAPAEPAGAVTRYGACRDKAGSLVAS